MREVARQLAQDVRASTPPIAPTPPAVAPIAPEPDALDRALVALDRTVDRIADCDPLDAVDRSLDRAERWLDRWLT